MGPGGLIFWVAMALAPLTTEGHSIPSLVGAPQDVATPPPNGPVYEPAPVVVWNRTITVFRAPYEQFSPADRAENAAARIVDLPEDVTEWNIEAQSATVGRYSGIMVLVNGRAMLAILPEDVDPESGETLQEAADEATIRIRAFLDARAQQRSLPLLLKGIGLSVAATLAFVIASWLLVLGRRCALFQLERAANDASRAWMLAGANIRPQLLAVQMGVARFVFWALQLTIAYLWLTFVLMRFPYSRPWGEQMGAFLARLLASLAGGVVHSIPDLFTVLVIFFLARLVVRVVGGFFQRVEEGRLPVPWLQAETARATRRLVIVLTWIFALVLAYPYIPGSSTDAFKGISVFVGLMVSLGSAGLVNQVMSGLVVVYARAFRTGDYIRVGDNEGKVTEVGVLSTKIVTRKREEITIPNAVLVSMTTVNYSQLAGEAGAVVSTSLTIGYDVPWRQVHAMLLLAAQRTPDVRRKPAPFVQQQALSDFYVEYQLFVHIGQPENRLAVLSELRAQIQDAFNEFEVQIMSPHFRAQPERPVFVPKPNWSPPPAADGPPTTEA